MAVLGLLLAWQGWSWKVTTTRPTVGDTIALETAVTLDPGWRLRPGRFEPAGDVEPLTDPVLTRDGNAWVVRYAVVAWSPGRHQVTLPPAWRLGPDGKADSLPGATAVFTVAAVIPDSVTHPAPQPVLVPVRRRSSSPWPVALAILGGACLLATMVALRRKRPRNIMLPDQLQVSLEANEAAWLAAGEPRAVAARAAAALRGAIAAAVPEAHVGLSPLDCVAVLGRERPGAPLAELETILSALEEASFGAANGEDLAILSRQAETLARALGEGA